MENENYYDSNWSQNSDHSSPFPVAVTVPTQILPHVSNSFQYPIEWTSEDRAASASKNHSQAEKRRRDRINTQIANLRNLIPMSDKMDKAALLGSVIEQVKDLKRKAMDISRTITVPTEIDEVSIDYDNVEDHESNTNNKVNKLKQNINIKASVCCDDRPELFSELIQVLEGLKLTAVKAEIASVGGRIKSILVLCCNKDSEENVCLNTLKQSLKSAVTKVVTSFSMVSYCPIRSKRQRFFLPSHFLQ